MFLINDSKKVLVTSIVRLYKKCDKVYNNDFSFTAYGKRNIVKSEDMVYSSFYMEKGGVKESNIVDCFKRYAKAGLLDLELGFEDENDKIIKIVFHKLNGKACNIELEF